MNARQFLEYHVAKTRNALRSNDFFGLEKNSLHLSGKKTCDFLEQLAGKRKKAFSLVVLPTEAVEPPEWGAMVTPDKVFRTSENIVWKNGTIRFATPTGLLVSGEQYDFVLQNNLSKDQLLAKSNSSRHDIYSVWKSMTRRANNARKDKMKEILYLTVGTLNWFATIGCTQKSYTSPLFFCMIRDDTTMGEGFHCKVIGDFFRINGVLAREFKDRFHIDIYKNLPSEISFSDMRSALEEVRKNIEPLLNQMTFGAEEMNICILDSGNETICQAVENLYGKLEKSDLVRILAEEIKNPEIESGDAEGIYPLSADDSQRDVIKKALAGNNINVGAAAGTGKSQTMVNIAANMVTIGKSVCIMSEKAAANEVFIKYAQNIGLDQFCLVLTNSMTATDIISQVNRIVNSPRLYVNSLQARELLKSKETAENGFLNLNRHIYSPLPDLHTSLYDLIGEAISAPAFSTEGITARGENYLNIKTKIQELKNSVGGISDFSNFIRCIQNGTSGNEEADEILFSILEPLKNWGVDVAFIAQNNPIEENFFDRIWATVTTYLATFYIRQADMHTIGTMRLSAMFRNLAGIYETMSELYSAFMLQEVSAHIQRASRNSDFIGVLDRLRTDSGNIHLSDLFQTYGEDILTLCPIIVTTPETAVTYLLRGMNTFNVLMIDEASQMPITGVLPFLLGKKQLITFGDAMQLGVTNYWLRRDGDAQDEEGNFDIRYTDKSILHVVTGKLLNCQLIYHYRSKTAQLLTVSNATCYDGTLNLIPDIYLDRDTLPNSLGYELVRIHSPQIDAKGNHSEAVAIARRVCAIKDDTPEKTIGIIAFNEKQQNLILDELEQRVRDGLVANLDSDEDIWIRSLETAQGKEADVILISIGQNLICANGSIRQVVSDINRPGGVNRLNVLFTRAREKNIIYISFPYDLLQRSDNLNILRLYDYLYYADTGRTNERIERKTAPSDPLNENLYKRLRAENDNYTVHKKIGDNVLMVDLAVSEKNGDRYAVGLILPPVPLSPNTLYTKIKVLERSGWRLMPLSPTKLPTESVQTTWDNIQSAMANGTGSLLRKTSPLLIKTTNTQAEPLRLEEIMKIPKPTVPFLLTEDFITPLTDLDIITYDFIGAYKDVIDPALWTESEADLIVRVTYSKDDMAFLVYFIRKRTEYMESEKMSQMFRTLNALYNRGEKRVGFFMAQLLRTKSPLEGNKELIFYLLQEAQTLGIHIE